LPNLPKSFSPRRGRRDDAAVVRIHSGLGRRAQEGRNAQELSAELGISTWSYYNWKRRLAIEVAPVLRPVAIVESFTPQSPVPQPVLVSPSGYRVEGLTVEGVAQLLRQLA